MGMIEEASITESTTRNRLLQAATQLFANKGYEATSVNEIVGAAGVTKPILYYYFKNKEGLYLEILRDAYDGFDRMLDISAQRAGSATEQILQLFAQLADLLSDKLEAARMIHSVYYGPPQGAPSFDFDSHRLKYLGTVRKMVEDGIASGEFRYPNPDDITMALAGMMSITMELELCRIGPSLGRDGLQRILKMLFEGIQTR